MYKGAIYENIVADAFSKSGRSLFYFHKESGLEIDFITPLDAEVTLVEVKATNGNAKSANTVLKNRTGGREIDIAILYGFPAQIVDFTPRKRRRKLPGGFMYTDGNADRILEMFEGGA